MTWPDAYQKHARRVSPALYPVAVEIESEVRDLEPDLRRRIRQEQAVPVMNMLHAWMIVQRNLVPEGSAISKALDYSLKRWAALSRYLDDGAVPIDNNWAENQIRPWALGRKNWHFAGSLRSGKRAAAIMSLIQSARLNGHDPYAYLKDVLTRLPTQRASEITELCRKTGSSPHHAMGRERLRVSRSCVGILKLCKNSMLPFESCHS